jgi:hypothetical protein
MLNIGFFKGKIYLHIQFHPLGIHLFFLSLANPVRSFFFGLIYIFNDEVRRKICFER